MIKSPSSPKATPVLVESHQNKVQTKEIPSFDSNSKEKLFFSEIEGLELKLLQRQLEILNFNESKLLQDIETMQSENLKLQSDKEKLLESQQDLLETCETLQRNLENELEKVKNKLKTFSRSKNPHEKQKNSQEIDDLHNFLQLLYIQISEKDEEIAFLTQAIQNTRQELKNFGSENSNFFSQAEPPPPLYLNTIEPHSPGSRRLLSDVGSTGAWSAHQKILEETKFSQFASPDPLENLFHQSTGETSQHNKEEPATPPNEYSQEYEERKHYDDEEEKIGTPKRKNAVKAKFYVN